MSRVTCHNSCVSHVTFFVCHKSVCHKCHMSHSLCVTNLSVTNVTCHVFCMSQICLEKMSHVTFLCVPNVMCHITHSLCVTNVTYHTSHFIVSQCHIFCFSQIFCVTRLIFCVSQISCVKKTEWIKAKKAARSKAKRFSEAQQTPAEQLAFRGPIGPEIERCKIVLVYHN